MRNELRYPPLKSARAEGAGPVSDLKISKMPDAVRNGREARSVCCLRRVFLHIGVYAERKQRSIAYNRFGYRACRILNIFSMYARQGSSAAKGCS